MKPIIYLMGLIVFCSIVLATVTITENGGTLDRAVITTDNFTKDWNMTSNATMSNMSLIINGTTIEQIIAYPFTANNSPLTAVDRTNVNNGTFTGYTFNNGLISGATQNSDGGMSFVNTSWNSINMSSSIIGANTSFTTCAWFNQSSTAIQGIVSEDDGSNRDWFMAPNAVRIYSSNGTAYSSALGAPAANIWHFGCIIFNNGNGSFITSLNGNYVLRASGISGLRNSGANTRIGRYFSTIPFAFNGSIQGVTIYNRSLNSTEILAQYTAGRNSLPLSGDGLVASYPMQPYSNNVTHTLDLNQYTANASARTTTNKYITKPSNTINTTAMWIKNGNGIWNHYVNSSGTYYLNGAVTSSFELPINITSIGVYQNGTFCNCSIDKVAIYNRSITQDEITQLYNNWTYNPADTLSTGLVAYYDFELNTYSYSGVKTDLTKEYGVLYKPTTQLWNFVINSNKTTNYYTTPISLNATDTESTTNAYSVVTKATFPTGVRINPTCGIYQSIGVGWWEIR